MVAISRRRTKIWVVPAGTAASELVSTAPYSSSNVKGFIAGEVKSYSKSGGERDVESDPVFGGFVDKEQPETQVELSFEIVPSFEYGDLWESMFYGYDSENNAYTSAAPVPSNRAVFIEALNGTTSCKGWGFNNAFVTTNDIEHNADDNQTRNLTLKLSPETDLGRPNVIFNSTVKDTTFSEIQDLPAWSAFED